MFESTHLSIAIDCPPSEVYRYARNALNLPEWATGLARSSVEKDGEAWIVEAPFGKARVAFAPDNRFGVLDHEVRVGAAPAALNPMRVVPNGEGSEVLFSVFRRPDASDEEYAGDTAAVQRDLIALKSILEKL